MVEQIKIFSILEDFMQKTDYNWNHDDWQKLISDVKSLDIDINESELGQLLENEKIRHQRKIMINEIEKKLIRQFEDLVNEVVSLNLSKKALEREVNDLKVKKEEILNFVVTHEHKKKNFEFEKKIFQEQSKRLEYEKNLLNETKKIIEEEKNRSKEFESRINKDFTGTMNTAKEADIRKELHAYEAMLKMKENRLFEIEKDINKRLARMMHREDSLHHYEKLLDKKKKPLIKRILGKN